MRWRSSELMRLIVSLRDFPNICPTHSFGGFGGSGGFFLTLGTGLEGLRVTLGGSGAFFLGFLGRALGTGLEGLRVTLGGFFGGFLG